MLSKEEIFAEIEKERGGVAEIYSAFSEIPATIIKAHFELNKALMLEDDLPLSRVEREWLALEVSRVNRCDYAVEHHTKAYEVHRRVLSHPPDPNRTKILSELARILSKNPEIAPKLEEKFLTVGFSKAEWLHAIKIVAYFNFTNRLALGLALKLEPDFEKSCK